MNREVICFDAVAPARERGLKNVTRQDFMGAPPKLYLAGIQIKKLDCQSETEAAVQ